MLNKKFNLVYLMLFLMLAALAGIFLYNSIADINAAVNSCCYHECSVADMNAGATICMGDRVFKCCADCDVDIYRDWCAPDCVDPDGLDCAASGQICENGQCVNFNAFNTCSDGTSYGQCSISQPRPNIAIIAE